MVGRACESRLVLGALVATLLATRANSLQGESHSLSRERHPLIIAAIRKASARLAEPGCQRIFFDFPDSEGRTLQQKLIFLGHTGQTYLEEILFYDASHEARCETTSVFAWTLPGSHAVFLCSHKLIERILRNSNWAPAVIIHEELHSLGLGENPPSSEEISLQVLSRCAY